MSGAYLELKAGKQSQQIPLDAERLSIGRQSACDVVLEDSQASRNHCLIERSGADFVLRDLDSRNGTRVNGQLVTSVVLAPKDVITIGAAQLTFFAPDEPTEVEDEVEVLSSDDLVDYEPDTEQSRALSGFVVKGDQYEQGLEKLANALPDGGFGEADVEMVNARGGMMHAANTNRKAGPREAVDLFRLVLLICFRSRASDIHIEPKQEGTSCRLRIDGNMVDVMLVPSQIGIKITTLVKVLSDIDISQRNTIQEGHFSARVPTKKPGAKRRVDYRVSFAPALHGQKLVIRILDTANAPLRLGDLQLPTHMYASLGSAIRQDSGMVLVAGPTGSGKTTSLYALLRSIDTNTRNVVTIEDPVEIQLENITQIPVDEAHEKGFAQLLRSVLRQDPDVLLVGEVRDSETARIAMQAAITGHLVFSTIHTKDTIGTIFRLLDLGVEPYLIGQGLQMVLAQRLVRKLCPHCKKPITPTPAQRAAINEVTPFENGKIFVPHGCPKCLGTGFVGRQAFFELLKVTDELRDVILRNPAMQDIEAAVSKTGFKRLKTNALELVAQGVTPFDEVDRMSNRDR